MDTKSLLEKLEQDIASLEEEYRPLREEAMNFEGTPEHEEYHAIIASQGVSRENLDIVLSEKFPEQFAMYQKMAELDKKHAAFIEIAKSFATKLYSEIAVTLERIEKRVETAKEYIKDLDKEIDDKRKEIEEVKASQEYKNADEKTLLIVGKMEKQLKALIDDKEEVTSKIEGLSKALERLKEEQEELVNLYGEEVKSAPNEQVEEQPQTDEDNRRGNSKGGNGEALSTTGSGVNKDKEELTPEQKAQKEFDDLCLKAETGKLSEAEFDKLVEIMKNPENYEKFGITTGVIFNKSRKITKALKKSIKKPEALLKAIDINFPSDKINIWKLSEKEAFDTLMAMDRETLTTEQQAVYDSVKNNLSKKDTIKEIKEVAKSVRDERTFKRFSWLLEKAEGETPPALPSTPGEADSVKKPTLGDELGAQTVPDSEYEDVRPTTRTVNEPEQTK